MLKNIYQFNNTSDYLPIITAALIVDMFVISRMVFGQINIKSLKEWYDRFGFLAVLADVLSLVIGVIISRFLYPFIFGQYSLIKFLILTLFIQIIHDLSFAVFFNMIPKNKSIILDVFKRYGREVGFVILIADGLMITSTILLGSYLSTLSTNINIIILMVSLYILPYLLYST